jgi:hypothetical protein
MTAKDILRTGQRGHNVIKTLPENNAIIYYTEDSEEDGEQILMHYWEIANPVAPDHARLAIFSYTILRTQANNPDIQDTIKLLNSEIEQCIFSKELGE